MPVPRRGRHPKGSGGNAVFFQQYDASGEAMLRVLTGVLIFYVLWGFIWFAVKNLLLCPLCLISEDS